MDNPNPTPEEPSEAEPGTELERACAERDKLREQLLRTAADFDNYRKRTRRELEDARARGQNDVVRDLLPVFDNLERALAAAQPSSGQAVTDAGPVIEGVRMVHKLFEDTAERMGLSRVKTVGERFDPAVHEAIQQKETDEAPPGTILSEVVAGYRFGERLVRAAMVVVARKPSAQAQGEPSAANASAPPPAYPTPSSTPPSNKPPPDRPASSRPPDSQDAAAASQSKRPSGKPEATGTDSSENKGSK